MNHIAFSGYGASPAGFTGGSSFLRRRTHGLETDVSPVLRLCGVGLLVLGWFSAVGADYYVDPVSGSMTNAGTAAQPWSTLEAVMSSGKTFQAGDVLNLRSGHHGDVTLRGEHADYVTVRPQPGHLPTLKRVVLRSARHWRLQGVTISPETAPVFERIELITLQSSASQNIVEGCFLHSVTNISAWTLDDWNTRSCNGMGVSGPLNLIRSNQVLNVYFGITVSGASNVVERNRIENFGADSLRGLGDFCVFQFNTVMNSHDVSANHDDGFQSWSVGPDGVGTGVVRGVVLRGNTIIQFSDPAQPFRGGMQGIGCFDGFFEDWVVENNVVMVDHWHGITFSGARNCRIVNNTVVDLDPAGSGPPWIRIGPHKNGEPSTGNVIRNNLATDYNSSAGVGVVDHNQEISSYATYFVDYAAGDLRLVPTAPAIDAGSADGAPATDRAGVPRPLDGNADGVALPDLGAHEFVHPTADTDADAMSDAWEIQHTLNALFVDAGEDPDHDAADNLHEYWADTDPRDRSAVLALTLTLDRVTGEDVLEWRSSAARFYTLERSADLRAWEDVAGNVRLPGTGRPMSARLATPAVGQYYRLRVFLTP